MNRSRPSPSEPNAVPEHSDTDVPADRPDPEQVAKTRAERIASAQAMILATYADTFRRLAK